MLCDTLFLVSYCIVWSTLYNSIVFRPSFVESCSVRYPEIILNWFQLNINSSSDLFRKGLPINVFPGHNYHNTIDVVSWCTSSLAPGLWFLPLPVLALDQWILLPSLYSMFINYFGTFNPMVSWTQTNFTEIGSATALISFWHTNSSLKVILGFSKALRAA